MFHIPSARARATLCAALAVLTLSGCKDVYDTTLANGMRVIVKEDHRSPVVVSMVWYKVGSIDEPKGHTGVSHALEHMMFKGTTHHKPNEFSRIIAENGGRENAFTSYDYTAYFQQLEKSRLPIALDLEADRMQNLTLAPEQFAKEIQVVMEERRLRTDDRPESLTFERMMHAAYRVNPYRHPVIGWMEDLKKMKVADVRDWYRRWYRPNNAVLVVAGDVTPSKVVELAKKYFGPIPAQPFVRPKIPPEPPQKSERAITVRVPAQVPYLLMGYHVPVFSAGGGSDHAWEPYALKVLAGVLDGGESARLQRDLVRGQKVAASIDIDYDAVGRAPTMFILDGTPASGHDVKDLEQALRAEIERIKKEPVASDELKRVKAQVVARVVFQRDSVFYEAMQLGRLAISGLDLNLSDNRAKRLEEVTPEQVAAVARKYLVDSNLTTARLDPLPMAPGAKSRPRAMMGGSDAR